MGSGQSSSQLLVAARGDNLGASPATGRWLVVFFSSRAAMSQRSRSAPNSSVGDATEAAPRRLAGLVNVLRDLLTGRTIPLDQFANNMFAASPVVAFLGGL
jgi:hypothetical protein